jgi:hypothetical protein
MSCRDKFTGIRRAAILAALSVSAVQFATVAPAQETSRQLPNTARPAQEQPYQSPGTKKMAALLAKIYRETDWKADPNKPAERVPYYQSLLQQNLTWPNQVAVRMEMAKEMLRAGNSEDAIHALENLRRISEQSDHTLPPEVIQELGAWLGLSYLRLGEQENCAHMHGQRSCIFPIRGSGVHTLTRGAQGAVKEFSALLAKNPDDDQSRWLLNEAYMQLGRYPRDVPRAWLIPSSLFDSEQDLGEFPDIAMMAGLDVTGHAGGAIMEDFDGDGLLDILVTSSGPEEQMHLFHNQGDGTFKDVTAQAGLTGETGGLNVVVTDYNNDGRPDVLVLRGGWWNKYGHYPMSLLRNNGDGTFDDVTETAGLLSMAPTQTAAWADFDNDGWLDLFVGRESTPNDPNPSQLFHNNHDGTFTEMAAPMGLAQLGFVKGVAWGDFNNDGRPDLYVSVLDGPNHLFRNDGPGKVGAAFWKFTDVTDAAGVANQRHSFATWFFDYDNDGWPDIFSAGYSTESAKDVGAFEMGKPYEGETPRLYHNNHDGTFTDVTKSVHLDRVILTMGANFGDLDNDGFLDIYLGTGDSTYQALLPNRMFRNGEGKRFLDVTTSGGFGHLQKGHAIAFGDLENTGNEDIFEEMGGALPGDTFQSALYHNPGHGNHWITLELEGVITNRAAFGARIDCTITENGRKRHIYRTVGYGSSFGGNPLRQHIGIGSAATVDKIEVTWPTSRTLQQFQNVKADQTLRLREGVERLEPVDIPASAQR